MYILKEQDLDAVIPIDAFGFVTTADLIAQQPAVESEAHGWVAQSEAKKAALFGLNIEQRGFNILVLGAQGSGRTSLMLSAMKEVATRHRSNGCLHDLVALYDFGQLGQPTLLKLSVGLGAKLRLEMDEFVRALVSELPQLVTTDSQQEILDKAEKWLDQASKQLLDTFKNTSSEELLNYFNLIPNEVLNYLKAWQPPPANETENALESLLNESFFARFRVNLMVDQRATEVDGFTQSVVYDNDPSLQSLFGGIESMSDASLMPDFIRLRAGHLHKADGGMLMLHIRDILNDEQNGSQILEKLHRFLRNGTLQIEDVSASTQSSTYLANNTVLPLHVKLILIATREDFYSCLDEQPDFFDYFPIKVEFSERILANTENYAAIAGFVAQKCRQHQCAHFTREAVAGLIGSLQRLEEDQTRISTNFAYLEQLMLEGAAFAKDSDVVGIEHVNAAIQAKSQRNQYFESQIRDSIIDNELLIQAHGEVIGQVNGLTHIELGDASFGSPIRITARCYPGKTGLINIDREVNMSGPNHDKGIFILQNWLSASFWHLAPLSLNASLVFEQEYNGVEGDSASCAELFALLSALAGLPIKQGIAVTGALNQFGEVMPIGGVNEKIEGYFRVCMALGLNGQQGVIIPKRNQRHLLLAKEVIQAVRSGQFHIIAIDHVLEGIHFLTGIEAGIQNSAGVYPDNTVMGHAQAALASYRRTLESNQPTHQMNNV
ncbi:MAG: Lon protease family protein [Methylophilus sp.]